MISDLVVNEEIKKYVRKPLGKLIQEKDLRANFKGNVIAVGDKVTLTCQKLGLTPRVAIVDYKIMRNKISAKDKRQLQKIGTAKLRAKNPAGTISLEAWDKLREALELPVRTARIEIEGEDNSFSKTVRINAHDVANNARFTVWNIPQPGSGVDVPDTGLYKIKFSLIKDAALSDPLCGDEINIGIKIENNEIKEIKFNCEGCAISKASASIVSEKIIGKNIKDIMKLEKEFVLDLLKIPLNPMRIKCAMLFLRALQKSIAQYLVKNDIRN